MERLSAVDVEEAEVTALKWIREAEELEGFQVSSR